MRISYADHDDLYQQILAYQHAFTQPTPKYAQQGANGWRTIPHALGYRQVLDHLQHKRMLGTLGRWYPEYGVLDFDDAKMSYIEQVRSTLGLHEGNSMLFSSPSADSYHLYFRPVIGDKKPTLRYYTKAMHYVATHYCEVYPQANRVIRLPFGKGQQWVKNGIKRAIDYVDGMQQLAELEEYQLAQHGYYEALDELDDPLQNPRLEQLKSGWKREGLAYLNEGLIGYNQRLEATKRVIYFFWTQNVTPQVCAEETKKWIKTKNNGYSADWSANYRAVYQQIDELTQWLYTAFEAKYVLPDVPQLIDAGYHTTESVRSVVQAAKGSLPLLKFALPLVGYCSARGGKSVGVHRDRLESWASTRTYLRNIEQLEQGGLLTRGSHYSVGNFAKKITLHTPQTRLADKITLADDADRAEHDTKRLIMASYTQGEYFHTQKKFGLISRTIRQQIDEIWGDDKLPVVNIRAKADNKSRIEAYLAEYPKATQKQVAKALEISLRTVKTYYQARGKRCNLRKKRQHIYIASLPGDMQKEGDSE